VNTFFEEVVNDIKNDTGTSARAKQRLLTICSDHGWQAAQAAHLLYAMGKTDQADETRQEIAGTIQRNKEAKAAS
jgi:hypothetical protein